MANLFPYNTNWTAGLKAQTDAPGVLNDLKTVVMYDAGSPVVADVDYVVVSEAMHVGTYTIAAATLAIARNITVKHTATSTVDTLGTIEVVGTDIAGAAITETITPSSGATVQGTKAFKTVTSVTGAGWVVAAGADLLEVGFGDLIGLPDKLSGNTVLMAIFNAVREATAPTVTVSSTVLSLNTVDLNSALDGSTVQIYYIV